jgi:hypothetical protein
VDKNLDTLIKRLCIFNNETGLPPTSEKEMSLLKIQLLIARIIASDLIRIKEVSPELPNDEIIDYLLGNWTENLRSFVTAILLLDGVDKYDFDCEKDFALLRSFIGRA